MRRSVITTHGSGVENAQGIEYLYGSIGAEGEGKALELHGAVGMGMAVTFTPVAFGDVAVSYRVERLNGRDNTQALHPFQVRRCNQLHVFKAIAQAREVARRRAMVGQVLLGSLDRVESNMGRAIADGMNSDTDAHLRGGADRLIHLLLRERKNAAIVGVAFKTFQHVGSLRTKRAIGEDFDAAQAPHIVNKYVLQTLRTQLGQLLARQDHLYAHPQFSLVAQVLKEVEGIHILNVVNSSDAAFL